MFAYRKIAIHHVLYCSFFSTLQDMALNIYLGVVTNNSERDVGKISKQDASSLCDWYTPRCASMMTLQPWYIRTHPRTSNGHLLAIMSLVLNNKLPFWRLFRGMFRTQKNLRCGQRRALHICTTVHTKSLNVLYMLLVMDWASEQVGMANRGGILWILWRRWSPRTSNNGTWNRNLYSVAETYASLLNVFKMKKSRLPLAFYERFKAPGSRQQAPLYLFKAVERKFCTREGKKKN